MIRAIAILLVFQLAGESLARGTGLPLPGPVLGLTFLFVALMVWSPLRAMVEDTAHALLSHLSLLFVPAGVGVVAHLDTFGRQGPALMVALIVSTAASILVAVVVFRAVAKLTGADDD
ncbi:Antiholin-like protein LrgA [Rhodobacteraceae bacterium THAF1]|uniref:CidA/LrgA family protein n=1 Tax=Palleronia sp. THAF1 TaxID=2587842 RepID=UPI000F3EAC6C|nr:CidA/LrgA family protein [Palleronia sp. THAF1]QFU08035.1 Antiholin-like protein LrgA [Palleronia sp. THAF1]VDC27888.1 Antiholin-like protein LrgA [Rhodobacteraceae bacterium THAF1]